MKYFKKILEILIIAIILGAVFTLYPSRTTNEKVYAHGIDPTCDVTDYGATGDGTTNDTTSIQNAINACELTGGIVWIPHGTYMVDPLTIDASYVIIEGEGRASALVLRPQNLSTLGDHAVLGFVGTSGATLKNVGVRSISIDGNKSAHTGTVSLNMEVIGFDYVRNGEVQDNYITNAIAEGIDVDNSSTSKFVGNVIYNTGGNGIHISNGSTYNIISGNYVQGCGFYGTWARNGIDQYGSAQYNSYESNISRSNYRNYAINGSGGAKFGDANISSGSTTASDEFLGL